MTGLTRVLLFLFVTNVLMREAASQTGTDAKNLRTQLFTTDGYDKKVRSATNVSDPTEVWTTLYLLSVNGLDEATETLKTTGYLYVYWKDSYLVWNASDYGGLSYTFFPQDDVWKPDVALKNSVVEYKQLGVKSLNVYVDYTGWVYWYPFQMFQSSCSIDISNFPFDVQTCTLEFVAWSYTKAEVDMQLGSSGIDLYYYQTSPQWEIINSSGAVELDKVEASVVFTLKMKRKPRHTLLTVIVPIVMLSLLNVSVFVLPCDSGEKASYAITVFLAFAVFLTIVSNSLPENSDSISIFSIYLIIQTIQSTLITLLAMLLIRMSHFSTMRVPRIFVWLVAILSCKTCSGKSTKVVAIDRDEATNKVTINDSLTAVDVKSTHEKERSPADEDSCDWMMVVNALDVVLMCFFFLVTVLSTAISLGIAYASSVAQSQS